jgi:hypothetical protein
MRRIASLIAPDQVWRIGDADIAESSSSQIVGLIHNLDGHVIAFSGSDLGVVL